jgi:Putative DNA-binding domain
MNEEINVQVTDAELFEKLANTENGYVERKPASASAMKDCIRTTVAFANSIPVGQAGIVFINVGNDGKVIPQPSNYNFEELQKTYSREISQVWPPIYYSSRVLTKDGQQFVAIVVWGSPLRPHFTGGSYVRIGPETKKATEEQYDIMVAERSSKVRMLKRLQGELVNFQAVNYAPGSGTVKIAEVNQFFVSLKNADAAPFERHFPIEWIQISKSDGRYLLIIVAPI